MTREEKIREHMLRISDAVCLLLAEKDRSVQDEFLKRCVAMLPGAETAYDARYQQFWLRFLDDLTDTWRDLEVIQR